MLGAAVSSEYGGCSCFYQFWEAKSCKEVGFIRHVCFRKSFENSLSESSFLLQVFLSFCSKALCLFRLRLRIERGCELRPWLRPAGESETCPGRQTAGRRLSSCCDLSERHRGLLHRPHHRPWKVINIEATHIWVRVKDCPSPVKIKNAEKLDVSDLLQKVKERSLL